MEPFTAIVSSLIFLCILYKFAGGKKSDPKAPPCLPAVPILGSLPFLYNFGMLFYCLTDKTKKYGNVFAFYSGSEYTVILNGYDAIREALVKKATDFAGRRAFYSDRTVLNVEGRGLIFKNYGEGFKANQSVTMAILKLFGYADKGVMEARIQDEVGELVKHFRTTKGAATYPPHYFELATLNVMYSLLFGERLDENDPIKRFITDTFELIVKGYDPKYELFPLLARLPSSKKSFAKLGAEGEKLKDLIMKKIEESKKKDDDNFVKAYIEKTGSNYDEKELVLIIRDLILAGSETTATTLSWFLVFMGNNPEAQRQIQKEIDAAVPPERLPSLYDMQKLPHVEAVIQEILRVRPISPLSVPHITTCDTEVSGYKIPGNTMIIVNLWSAHFDSEVWPEPEKFRPERFLDENGQLTNKNLMLAFSLGKRSCLGELLARQELFLFMSGLLQSFNILPPEGSESVRDEMIFDQTVRPLPYQARLVPRK